MIKRRYERMAQQRAYDAFIRAGVPIRKDEIDSIAIVDFGLDRFEIEGMHLFTLVNTTRYAAKALYHLPWQTEPEHWHPPIDENNPGKQETIRALWGICYFYLEGGTLDSRISGRIPSGQEDVYTARKEYVLHPGDQITIEPGAKHWFQGGPEGAVIYTYSSTAVDVLDGFTDVKVNRRTQYVEEEALD